jgi:hypothetical protein
MNVFLSFVISSAVKKAAKHDSAFFPFNGDRKKSGKNVYGQISLI